VKNQQTWDKKLRRNKLEIRLKDFSHALKLVKKEKRLLKIIHTSLKSRRRKRKKSNDRKNEDLIIIILNNSN
jgi:hypothetical protein